MTRKMTAIFWVAIGCAIIATSLAVAAWAMFGREVWAVIFGD